MRTNSIFSIVLFIALSFTHAAARVPEAAGQVPSGCRNNDTSRCAQPLALSTTVEGLVGGGGGNSKNYFVVEILRPGLYSLTTTRDRHPQGGTAGIKIDMVDSDGYSILSRWLNGSRLEQTDLIEISVPGRYFLTMNYGGSGNTPVRFTATLRPRPRS